MAPTWAVEPARVGDGQGADVEPEGISALVASGVWPRRWSRSRRPRRRGAKKGIPVRAGVEPRGSPEEPRTAECSEEARRRRRRRSRGGRRRGGRGRRERRRRSKDGESGHQGVEGQEEEGRRADERAAGLGRRQSERGRGTRYAAVIVETVNVSGWTSLRDYLSQTKATVLLVQEHKQDTDALADVDRKVRQLGWRALWAHATRTAGGFHGGTAVLARAHVGLSVCMDRPGRVTQAGCIVPGSAAAGHIWACFRGGLKAISVYLNDGQGMSAENMDILDAVAAEVRTARGPWLAGGDWIMPPKRLEAWANSLGAVVLATKEDTYASGAARSKIDYFIVPAELVGEVVRPRVVQETTVKSHWPVALGLKAHPRALAKRTLAKVATFEVEKPIGCVRGVVDWSAAGEACRGATNQESLQEAHDAVVGCIEDELVLVHDLVAEDAESHRGRVGKPKFVKVPVVGRKSDNWPSMDKETEAWARCHRWLDEVDSLRAAIGRAKDRGDKVGSREEELARLFNRIAMSRHRGAVQEDEWRAWLGGLAWEDGQEHQSKRAEFAQLVGARIEKCVRDRRQAWRDWAKKAMMGGAGGGHRWSRARKVQDLCVPVEVEAQESGTVSKEYSMDPSLLADKEMKVWEEIWDGGGPQAPLTRPREVEELEEPTVEQARRAFRAFKKSTAVGADQLHPRTLDHLSDQGVRTFIALLMAVERIGDWPEHACLIILMLLAKPGGGYRTIGILATLYRVWVRIRRIQAKEWELEHTPECVYGGTGKSAESSAWRQSFRAEVAVSRGEHEASMLLDLEKCYETVGFQRTFEAARAEGCSVLLLWLAFSMYMQPRVVALEGALSAEVRAARGIVAGCGFATTWLRALMLPAIRTLQRAYSGLMMFVLADDITLQWVGRRMEDSKVLALATQYMVGELSGPMGLKVSQKKSAFVASSKEVEEAVVRPMRRLGFGAQQWMRNLGVDQFGRTRKRRMTKERIGKVKARMPRVVRLRRTVGRAITKVVTAGLKATWRYGIAVHGVPEVTLREQRTLVARAMGYSEATHHTISFMLEEHEDMDPIFEATRLPILKWCEQVWTKEVSVPDLRAAWEQAKESATRPGAWARVRGPIGAAVLSALRVGWDFVAPTVIRTHEGHTLDLNRAAPKEVDLKLKEAVKEWQWRKAGEQVPGWPQRSAQDEARPRMAWLEPIRATLKGLGAAAAGAVRTVVAGSFWSGPEREAKGKAVGHQCRYCEAEVDDWMHRYWRCPVCQDTRLAHDVAEQVHLGSSEATRDAEDPFWARGLRVEPSLTQPKNELVCVYGGNQWAEWEGNIYLDGSGFEPTSVALRRCGWSVVRMGAGGTVIKSMHGPLPGEVQTVPRAEHFALVMLVMVAQEAPQDAILRVRTDCKAVYDAWRSGPEGSTSPKKELAGFWRRIWQDLSRRPDVQLILTKVKAHTEEHEIGVAISQEDRTGNDKADEYAKIGARMHRLPRREREAYQDQREQVQDLVKAMGAVLEFGLEEKLWKDEEVPPVPKAPDEISFYAHDHLWCKEGKWYFCRACRKCTPSEARKKKLQAEPCVPWEDRLGMRGDQKGHALKETDSGTIWCVKCGAHATAQVLKLLKPCVGAKRVTRSGQRARDALARGIHPDSGASVGDSNWVIDPKERRLS